MPIITPNTDVNDALEYYEGVEREEWLYAELNRRGFRWVVFWAVSIGFLASSYSLFAMGIVSPALIYIYIPKDTQVSLVLDLAVLASTVVGMIIFGHLADRLGRKQLYGWELGIVIIATVGLVLSSDGYTNPASSDNPGAHSMDIFTSLIFFRCLLGFGVGAEYPVAALIAAEYTSTDTRAVMMASVFLMQSVARCLASGIGLGALRGFDSSESIDIDKVWRIVIGMGGVIAIGGFFLRLMIPESPRYWAGIQKNMKEALLAANKLSGGDDGAGRMQRALRAEDEGTEDDDDDVPPPWLKSALEYLKRGGWRKLATMSAIWFLLDLCFFGTSLDSPGTLNALWLDRTPPLPSSNRWNDDPGFPDATIKNILDENGQRTLLLSSISSLVGAILIIPVLYLKIVSRKVLLVATSLILSLIFIAIAVSVSQTYGKPQHTTSMFFFALAQFFVNLGPNTLTFIIAAEIFPTVFRGTFYGISAAWGKIGAIVIRVIVGSYLRGKVAMVWYFSVFSVLMLLLAGLAHYFLPLVEEKERSADIEKVPANKTSTTEAKRRDGDERKWVPRKRWIDLTLEKIAPYPIPETPSTATPVTHADEASDGAQVE